MSNIHERSKGNDYSTTYQASLHVYVEETGEHIGWFVHNFNEFDEGELMKLLLSEFTPKDSLTPVIIKSVVRLRGKGEYNDTAMDERFNKAARIKAIVEYVSYVKEAMEAIGGEVDAGQSRH